MGIGTLRRHYPENQPAAEAPVALVEEEAKQTDISEVAVKDLPEYLSKIGNLEEIRKYQAEDTRKSAAKAYEERISVLEAAQAEAAKAAEDAAAEAAAEAEAGGQ